MDVSPTRRRAAVAALALGGFAIGLTEFVAMGLLPQIARSLLPGQSAASMSNAVAHAGWMISAYALGVVAGAPTIAALTARVARKKLLLGLLALFIVGTVASAVAPTFGLVLVARFVAALRTARTSARRAWSPPRSWGRAARAAASRRCSAASPSPTWSVCR